MRRLAAPADGERGGIAVIVALLMVVLLGFAAISIDVGSSTPNAPSCRMVRMRPP